MATAATSAFCALAQSTFCLSQYRKLNTHLTRGVEPWPFLQLATRISTCAQSRSNSTPHLFRLTGTFFFFFCGRWLLRQSSRKRKQPTCKHSVQLTKFLEQFISTLLNRGAQKIFTSHRRQGYQFSLFSALIRPALHRRCPLPTHKIHRLPRLKLKTPGTRATRGCPRHHAASWANSVIAPTRGLASLGCSVTSINPCELPKEFPYPPTEDWHNNRAQSLHPERAEDCW